MWPLKRYIPSQRGILRDSLTVQADLMHTEAALLRVSSTQRQVLSVRLQVDWVMAVSKQLH
jgi:hypothetical protein